MMASYQPSPQDEGYSEDPLSGSTVLTSVPPWLSDMTTPNRCDRLDYVMRIISQLPTSDVAELVRRLRPRLYINFFNYLPPEVCLKILGFLDPDSLMRTAQASREWMSLALDRQLWEHLYMLDGFRVIRSEVTKFEESLTAERPRPNSYSQHDEEHARKRRATPQRILPTLSGDGDSEMTDVDVLMYKQPSIFGSVTGTQLTKEPVHDNDVTMTSPRSTSSGQSSKSSARQARYRDTMQARQNRKSMQSAASSQIPTVHSKSSLVVVDRSDNKKRLNWQYLYSQRRRLEANWEDEKYTNFQLPHPHYPEEAHEECIYTIQHSGKYLVSGSRDRTLRIWDLDTQRLIRPPLRAHSGSVLCLQFDADPEEDLIVSGSSDATIVLWKFSTGQIIQRLRKAHRESVLNVRFDKRVLVTCSKDKTIKIFNRRLMNPEDVGYPGLPGGVLPVPTFLNNYGYNPSPTAGLSPKQPYSLIGCLEGHAAAVNAVQIHGNEVVSASGDRTVKIWNWPEQVCTRTLVGHTKGIACVQYDGRRIVSGSSDNEVKVFDKASGVEVASLHAHKNLVRTVQAGFGDLPYSVEEDRNDAKMIDHEYFKAVDAGIVPHVAPLKGGRPRNAGSRKPEHITAYGAELPPGGGGGRFGRIVSGSYDETIIIWRRDKEGVWKAQHTLRQEEAALRASRAIQQASPPQPLTSLSPTITIPQLDADVSASTSAPGVAALNASYRHLVEITVPQGPAALRTVLTAHPQLLTRPELSEAIHNLPNTQKSAMRAVVSAALQVQHQLVTVGPQLAGSNQTQGPASIQSQPSTTTTTDAENNNQTPMTAVAPPPNVNVATNPTPPSANTPAAHVPAGPAQGNMARVFKLQFDARRIICCSQTSVIVGWDFANGDEQLIESSRFFAPIE